MSFGVQIRDLLHCKVYTTNFGADVTGSFTGKRGLICWNAHRRASKEILVALQNLKFFLQLEKYVCQSYSPARVSSVEFRWLLFIKNETTSEKLPPTRDAFVRRLFCGPITNA